MIYVLIFLLSSFFAEISVKLSNKFKHIITALLSILIPSYFAGIRYGIGTDYFSYQSNFELIQAGKHVRLEKGYSFINYIVSVLGGDVQTVFFIVSFLTVLFIYLALYDNRDKINVGIGMLVFMLLYYQISFNVVRQVLAIAVLLYSIKYIFRSELIKFVIFVLLATSFHMSAIIFLPLYFLYSLIVKKDNIRLQILTFIITFISVAYYDKIFLVFINLSPGLEYYSRYFENKESFDLGFGIFALNLPYILPGILLYKDMKENNDKFTFFYFIYIFGFVISFIGYHGIDYLNRIALNFTIINVILVPYYLRILINKKLYIYGVLLMIIIISFWFYNYMYLGQHQTLPYSTIFK